MRKSAAIIVNPVSGHGRSLRKAQKVQRLLDQSGLDVELLLTEAAQHGRTLANEIASSVEVLVCVGGDGTVNEVANGLVDAGQDTPILIIPTGTANVIFREIGLPGDLESQVKLAMDSSVRLLDLGRAGDRFFIMCAGAGFDAAIVDTISQTRTQSGISMLSYIMPTLRETFRYPFPRMRVTINGKDFDEGATFVVIANMQRYGGVRDFARYAWGAFRQNLMDYNDIAFYRGKQIKLEADERVLVQVDGDRGGELPMLFTLMPGAVSFCVEK
ncbi:MAG: NAD(+)/NADH kinase [Deltaproteobacteria bacterium]|nr:NAD(+)/NADH kinase [Deltaproteobacteria bacterium]